MIALMLAEPNCRKRGCRHLGEVVGGCTTRSEFVTCPAFPSGIPERIAYGDDAHDVVAADQVGRVVFELSNDGGKQ